MTTFEQQEIIYRRIIPYDYIRSYIAAIGLVPIFLSSSRATSIRRKSFIRTAAGDDGSNDETSFSVKLTLDMLAANHAVLSIAYQAID